MLVVMQALTTPSEGEKAHVPFISIRENTMHCCNHEAHPEFRFAPQEEQMWDQYGPLEPGDAIHYWTLMCDFPIMHNVINTNLFFVLAASQMTHTSFIWDPVQLSLKISFQGEETELDVLSEFWASCLLPATTSNLDLAIHATESLSEPGEPPLVAVHVKTGTFPLPQHVVTHMLSTMATKRMLDTLQCHDGIPIKIKWHSRILWEGKIHQDVMILTVLEILNHSCAPCLLGDEMRLIHRGKVRYDYKLGELIDGQDAAPLVLHAVGSCSGGTGGKETQKAYIRNSMPATFLEQGYPLDWVAKATEMIIEKIPVKQTLQVVQLRPGKQRIDSLIQLSQQCDLAPPEHFAKHAFKTAYMDQQLKTKKKRAVTLNPMEYTIGPGFFRDAE